MDRSERTVHRGEIYYADLNPVVGSEQGGIRPVLILQNEVGNWFSPTVIVAAVTAKGGKAHLPTHVPVGTNSGLRRPLPCAGGAGADDRQIPPAGSGGNSYPGGTKNRWTGRCSLASPFPHSERRNREWTQEESLITMGCSGF